MLILEMVNLPTVAIKKETSQAVLDIILRFSLSLSDQLVKDGKLLSNIHYI